MSRDGKNTERAAVRGNEGSYLEGPGGLKGLTERFSALIPLVAGLVISRVGLLTASYGGYARTDDGALTDSSMLIALAALGVLLAVITRRKTPLKKRFVNRLMLASIAVESLSGFAMAAMFALGEPFPGMRLAIGALVSLSASLCIFYWLRRARETNTVVAVVYVFTSLALSEALLYVLSVLPDFLEMALSASIVLLQYPLRLFARTRTIPKHIEGREFESDYFSFSKTEIQRRQFLMATAVGIGALSIVIGFLRGYPNGASIVFDPATRLAYPLAVIFCCSLIIIATLRGSERTTTVGMFVAMQLLAAIALVLYSAFPDALHIGAVPTTTLNALMVGFTWYVSLAFMSTGWRDPYYYTCAGWIVWIGCRAVTRLSIVALAPLALDSGLVLSVMSLILLVSAQIVFIQFLHVENQSQAESSPSCEGDCRSCRRKPNPSKLSKLMGLDNDSESAQTREEMMRQSARQMGRQFLLSDREIEVLALYAQGYTQKRVAETLFISQGTAHAHIKRIYAKTDLHSRQELIDYLEEYTS